MTNFSSFPNLASKVEAAKKMIAQAQANGTIGKHELMPTLNFSIWSGYDHLSGTTLNINLQALTLEDIPTIKSILLDPQYWWRDYERLQILNAWNSMLPKLQGKLDYTQVQPCEVMDAKGHNLYPIEAAIEALENGGRLTQGIDELVGRTKGWGKKNNWVVFVGQGLETTDPRKWVLPKGAVTCDDFMSKDVAEAYMGRLDIPSEGKVYNYHNRLLLKFDFNYTKFVEDGGSYNTHNYGRVIRYRIKPCDNPHVELFKTGGGGNAWVTSDEVLHYRLK
jgi:hypothetical protein